MSKKTKKGRAFTVLELTVATLVLLVALLIAARLLQDTAAQIAWSGRKAVEVSPDLALEQIRTDLRNSSGLLLLSTEWTSGPLTVAGSASGLPIVYGIEEGLLIRSTLDDEGVLSRRIALERMVDLRYRAYYGAIEVEITFLRMSPLLRKDTAAGTREKLTPELHRISLLVSPRRVLAESF